MAIVIDANRAGDFGRPLQYHASIILNKVASRHVRVAVGGKLLRELLGTGIRNLIVEWERSGRLVRAADAEVDAEELACAALPIASDDPHVLALVRITGARLVYTNDRPLMSDLKNVSICSPKGKVISTSTDQKIVRRLLITIGC